MKCLTQASLSKIPENNKVPLRFVVPVVVARAVSLILCLPYSCE